MITALAVAGTAYGQVPATNDTSDASDNTGMGKGALGFTGTNSGEFNTAAGVYALGSNTTGSFNTASGEAALISNQTGNDNTASGGGALYQNITGSSNTAAGYAALIGNTSGNYNTASGVAALAGAYSLRNLAGSTGSNNTGTGAFALNAYSTGSDNTASGYQALYSNTTGSDNIAEGYQAGYYLTTRSDNIDIGNVGVAAESSTIRIGTKGTQKATFIAGIYSTSMTGHQVMISSTGQLGVKVSSERFKTAIAPMESNTAKLQQLRPVTFHLKTDPRGALQYGLIAEEVAKVYPDLVIRDESGRIDGVRYDELAPMLLKEAQQQQQKMAVQERQLHDLQQQLAEMRVALLNLKINDELVARH
jgi:hypothetical protein